MVVPSILRRGVVALVFIVSVSVSVFPVISKPFSIVASY